MLDQPPNKTRINNHACEFWINSPRRKMGTHPLSLNHPRVFFFILRTLDCSNVSTRIILLQDIPNDFILLLLKTLQIDLKASISILFYYFIIILEASLLTLSEVTFLFYFISFKSYSLWPLEITSQHSILQIFSFYFQRAITLKCSVKYSSRNATLSVIN